ncbi:uncharacterized protein LOC110108190 isoform X4 [Dendrobium catenatum]|uniref:uncharacterized protein LOC110108190 isoform X4 n=1 Tax=Dendrobium catenatum TaxID=906689 RepID=UPI0009F6623D|nr:uncharacterized protein LOC110108190 isoform X4 [Dendrobium catenatum]
MAEEVAVGAESIVCETKEASTLEETEPKAPERLEEGTQAVSVEASALDSSDQKRKLADLEPFENDEAPAKKQQIDVSDAISENPAAAEDEVMVTSEVDKQDIEGEETVASGHPETEKPIPGEDAAASDGTLVSSAVDGNVGEEQPGHVRELDDAGLEQVKLEAEPVGNGQISSAENIQHAFVDDLQKPSPSTPHQGSFPHSGHQTSFDLSISRKIEVPNNKVGVLIGKAGETIRHLQINSGAKIQITRDGDNDPHSPMRHVELTGTMENINKAEQLIKDVIAEVHNMANAGGSPSLVARGFSTPQSGGEQIEMQIPSDKVGMIIGKGGETIKNLQTKTGARIQLLPQNLPNGDTSKERTVRITGYIKQVESARELIKDVMIQIWLYLSHEINVGILQKTSFFTWSTEEGYQLLTPVIADLLYSRRGLRGHHHAPIHTITSIHFGLPEGPLRQLNGVLVGEIQLIRHLVIIISREVCIHLKQHNTLNHMVVVIRNSNPLQEVAGNIRDLQLLLCRILIHLLEAMVTITTKVVVLSLTLNPQTPCLDPYLLRHRLRSTITTVSHKLQTAMDIKHPIHSLHLLSRTMDMATLNLTCTLNSSPWPHSLQCMDNHQLHHHHMAPLEGLSPATPCIKVLHQANIHQIHQCNSHIHIVPVLLLMAMQMGGTLSNLLLVILNTAVKAPPLQDMAKLDKQRLYHILSLFLRPAVTVSTHHLSQAMVIRQRRLM